MTGPDSPDGTPPIDMPEGYSWPVSLGIRAFDEYVVAIGGKAHDGGPIPPWPTLSNEMRRAWVEAGKASVRRALELGIVRLTTVEDEMPKISSTSGPSIAGLTTGDTSEAAYTAAMERHGTDKFTDADADVVRAWHAQEDARRVREADKHAELAEVAQAAEQDAAAKAGGGPDAKGVADRILEGAVTAEQRVQARAEHDEVNDDDSTSTTTKPVGDPDGDGEGKDDSDTPADDPGDDGKVAAKPAPVKATKATTSTRTSK